MTDVPFAAKSGPRELQVRPKRRLFISLALPDEVGTR